MSDRPIFPWNMAIEMSELGNGSRAIVVCLSTIADQLDLILDRLERLEADSD